MARERIKTLRSVARDDRDALQALAAHLPQPLRETIAPHKLSNSRRADEVITRIFEAAEENRRASRAPERDDRERRESFRN